MRLLEVPWLLALPLAPPPVPPPAPPRPPPPRPPNARTPAGHAHPVRARDSSRGRVQVITHRLRLFFKERFQVRGLGRILYVSRPASTNTNPKIERAH